MKKVMIIGSLIDDESANKVFGEYTKGVERLLEGEYEIYNTRITDLEFCISTDEFSVYDASHKMKLSEFDAIILHGQIRKYQNIAYTLSRYCSENSISFMNDYSLSYPGSKLGQAVVFHSQGVTIPKTVFAMRTDVFIQAIDRHLSFPLVLKDANGTKGELNFLVKSSAEAEALLDNHASTMFIAQEFYPNDRDYRLLLTPKRSLVIARQAGQDSHLNNTSQGGIARLATDEVPPEIIDQARRVAASLNLTLSGVDVMPHLETGIFCFIEINSQPQLMTGALLEEKETFVKDMFHDLLDTAK